VSKTLRNDYLLLIATLLGLGIGLFQEQGSLGSTLAYAAGATIGFGLSLLLLIRAIRL
jgi:hypothetical protein